MFNRDPKTIGKIIRNPAILVGKPTIAGTRISVELILDKIAAGESYKDILLDYTYLTEKDVTAAVNYANELVKTS